MTVAALSPAKFLGGKEEKYKERKEEEEEVGGGGEKSRRRRLGSPWYLRGIEQLAVD